MKARQWVCTYREKKKEQAGDGWLEKNAKPMSNAPS